MLRPTAIACDRGHRGGTTQTGEAVALAGSVGTRGMRESRATCCRAPAARAPLALAMIEGSRLWHIAKALVWLAGSGGDDWLGKEVSLRDESVRRAVGLIE